jgi:parallel beta-helix repeat protein
MKWLRSSGIFAVAVLLLSISSIRAWAVVHYVRISGSPCGVNHLSIQQAINHATDGDEILVGSGIYSERITVNKNRLIIHSQNDDVDQTIIQPPELTPAGVYITGNGNTFRGFTVEDQTPNSSHPHAHRLIFIQGDGNSILLNVLEGRKSTSYADVGILVRGGGVGDGIAENNTIRENEVCYVVGNGILSVSVASNNAARKNKILTNYVHDCKQGIYIDRSPYCQVNYNTVINNYGLGIGVRSRGTLSSAGTKLIGNFVSDNEVGAEFVACSGVTVGDEFSPNDFTANRIGILVRDEGAYTGAPTINYNNIYGNGTQEGVDDIGLQNNSVQRVDAKFNWWGDLGGPGADADGDGVYGDKVVGDVDYSDWLPERL